MTKETKEDCGHADFPPSSADKYMKCQAWKQLTENLVDPGNKYSDEGTDAHTFAEFIKFDKNPHDYIGKKLPKGYVVTDEMAQAIETYMSDAKFHSGWSEGSKDVEVSFEQKLVFNADVWGTADLLVYNKIDKVIQVHDLKYGRGRVNAEGNPQLLTYAYMAELTIADDSVDRFQVYIHQPRINHMDWHEYTREELMAFKKKHIDAVANNKKDDAYTKATPGDHCKKWCLARPNCYAHAAYVASKVTFNAKPGSVTISPGDIKPAIGLTNEQLSQIKQSEELVLGYYKAINAELHNRVIEKGEQVPGFKAVMGREGNRTFTSEPMALGFLQTNYDVKEEELYTKKLIPLTGFEKLVGKKEFKDAFDHLVYRSPARPCVAPEDDKRPAIAPKEELLDMLDGVEPKESAQEFVQGLVSTSIINTVSGKQSPVDKAVQSVMHKHANVISMLDELDNDKPENKKEEQKETEISLDYFF